MPEKKKPSAPRASTRAATSKPTPTPTAKPKSKQPTAAKTVAPEKAKQPIEFYAITAFLLGLAFGFGSIHSTPVGQPTPSPTASPSQTPEQPHYVIPTGQGFGEISSCPANREPKQSGISPRKANSGSSPCRKPGFDSSSADY